MKLDCKLEASGITEVMMFNTIRFNRMVTPNGKSYWEKYYMGKYDGSPRFTDIVLTDHQFMKMVKDIARRKNVHVWVSEHTLNIVRK